MALTDIQQAIYDKIRNWTEYAHGVGIHLVSPNYYYSWLLRTKLDTEEVLNAELRKMVNTGVITARTIRIAAKTEAELYNANKNTQTATILALPENEVKEIVDKYSKSHTKTRK